MMALLFVGESLLLHSLVQAQAVSLCKVLSYSRDLLVDWGFSSILVSGEGPSS